MRRRLLLRCFKLFNYLPIKIKMPAHRAAAPSKLEAATYLPIKIKMPAMSATTPITIAPIPM
jgi:hypothetical protein